MYRMHRRRRADEYRKRVRLFQLDFDNEAPIVDAGALYARIGG